ncbi:MAG: hypothetical protein WAM39_24790 [Bryobacteraceae bacterium]
MSYDRLADVDISRARRVRWSKCKTIASKTKKFGFSAFPQVGGGPSVGQQGAEEYAAENDDRN